MATMQQKQAFSGMPLRQSRPVVSARRPMQCQALFGKKASTAVLEKPSKTVSKTTSSKTTKQP